MSTRERLIRLVRARWYMATTLLLAAVLLVGALAAADWGLAAACGGLLAFGAISLAASYRRLL